MRIIHTSDWHLGHTLHNMPREYEHACFLQWLLVTIAEKQADALIFAGDLFDSANPSVAAMQTWLQFVVDARTLRPQLDMVFVGGNHDSAARLDALASVLGALGVHVVGGLPRQGKDTLDLGRLLVPLTDRTGAVAAWCAAVPFLRPNDLRVTEGGDPLIEGVRAVYSEVLDEARRRRTPRQAIVATGHCYMVGGAISELSERRILGGNQHALPVDIFPDDVAYAALGHLHLAQKVGGREGVRYAGSTIPLALDEERYAHQVALVELDGPDLLSVTSIRVPRAVDVLRVPKGGPGPIDEALAELAALPLAGDTPVEVWPWLEVRVVREGPEPMLRQRVDEALNGRAARLLRLDAPWRGDGLALADSEPLRNLRDLTEEEVFLRRWAQVYDTEPMPDVMAAWHDLVAEAHAGEGDKR